MTYEFKVTETYRVEADDRESAFDEFERRWIAHGDGTEIEADEYHTEEKVL